MAYTVYGCGLGTEYVQTKEEADDVKHWMNLCETVGHNAIVEEFTPKYLAVESRKDGESDEFTIYLGAEKDLKFAIRLAREHYDKLTKEEKKIKDIAVYLVDEDFLIDGVAYETMWMNGKDYTEPYTDEHATIRVSGNSLTIAVTDAAKALDLSAGDEVEITIKKKLRL